MASTAAQNPLNFRNIVSIGEGELDSLPYGVIQLNRDGGILRYNAYEKDSRGCQSRRWWARIFSNTSRLAPMSKSFTGAFAMG